MVSRILVINNHPELPYVNNIYYSMKICPTCGIISLKEKKCSCAESSVIVDSHEKKVPLPLKEVSEVTLWDRGAIGPLDIPCKICKNYTLYQRTSAPSRADEAMIIHTRCIHCKKYYHTE